MPHEVDVERNEILQKVRKWGGSASDATLDPSCNIFTLPNIEGMIAYKETEYCVAVLGDPICPPTDLPALTQAFHEHCEKLGKNIIYLTASKNFTDFAMPNFCKASLEFGEELIIDPQKDPRKNTGVHASLVRRKVRHAEHEGTTIAEYKGDDPAHEKEIEEVGRTWIKGRRGPQIYTSRIRLFEDRSGKRWFYAKHREKVVAVVVLNELQAKKGWHLNHLMTVPEAPHGTQELLVVSALETVANEGCRHVSFGTIKSSQLGKITGLGKVTEWLAGISFQIASRLFRIRGHKAFWEKFAPEASPSYILLREPKLGLQEVKTLLQALNSTITTS